MHVQDNGKKGESEREVEREGSQEGEDRDKKMIISSEEEAKARIAEKRREMKVQSIDHSTTLSRCVVR